VVHLAHSTVLTAVYFHKGSGESKFHPQL
jgi:hypothetical protein